MLRVDSFFARLIGVVLEDFARPGGPNLYRIALFNIERGLLVKTSVLDAFSHILFACGALFNDANPYARQLRNQRNWRFRLWSDA